MSKPPRAPSSAADSPLLAVGRPLPAHRSSMVVRGNVESAPAPLTMAPAPRAAPLTRTESRGVQVGTESDQVRQLKADLQDKMKVVSDYEFVLTTEVERRKKLEQQLSDLRASVGYITVTGLSAAAAASQQPSSSSSLSAGAPSLMSQVLGLKIEVESLKKEMVERDGVQRARVHELERDMMEWQRAAQAGDARAEQFRTQLSRKESEMGRQSLENTQLRQELSNLKGRIQTLESEVSLCSRDLSDAKRKNALLMEEHTQYQKQSDLEKGYLRDKLREMDQMHTELKTQLFVGTRGP